MIIGDCKGATIFLKNGDIIGYPTEAVYGLGCDPWNQEGVSRICSIKKRSSAKNFIVVAASINQLDNLIDTKILTKSVVNSWPGHTTWLIPAVNTAPEWLIDNNTGLIAIRVSNHETIKELCLKYNSPLISTSANISGDPAVTTQKGFEKVFEKAIPYLVNGDIGKHTNTSIINNMITGERIR